MVSPMFGAMVVSIDRICRRTSGLHWSTKRVSSGHRVCGDAGDVVQRDSSKGERAERA
jgi:hypothetical protein